MLRRSLLGSSRERIRRAFTLQELIVVLVITAILGALVVPLFGRVTTHARLSVAEHTLASIQRSLVAEASFGSNPGFPDVVRAAADTPANLAGTGDPFITLESNSTSLNRSTDPGTISAYVDPQSSVWLAVAIDGGCAFASARGTTVNTWSNTSGSGCSGFEASSPTVVVTAPGVPLQIAGALTGTRTIELSWKAPIATGGSTITSYEITTRSNAGTSTTSHTVDSLTLVGDRYRMSFSGLTLGSTYSYEVAASNSVGTGPTAGPTSDITIANVPDAPVLQAARGDREVALSWNTVTVDGATVNYRVYGYVNSVLTLIGSTSDTSITFTGLTNGTAKRYAVSGYTTDGEGLLSNTVDVTPIGVPSALTNLTASLSGSDVTLSWDDAPNTGAGPVATIRILRDGTLLDTIEATTPTFTDTSSVAGTSYRYSIRGVNEIGVGPATSIDVDVADVPGTPASFIATAGTGQVTLDWAAVASSATRPVSGYRLYQQISGVMTFVGSTSDTTLVINGLTNGTPYRFQVAAYGIAGEGSRSTTSTATPLAAPASITNMTATVADRSVTVSWDAAVSTTSAPVASIDLLRDGTVVTSVSAGTTSYTFSGLTAGTSYTFGVRPGNSVVDGQATTLDVTAVSLPAAPSGFSATPGDGEVSLDWNGVSSTSSAPVSGYRIYREINGVMILVGSVAGTSTVIDGLTNGATYRFEVAAYGTAGEGSRSNTVTAYPLGAPAALTNLNATLGDRSITISWAAPADSTTAPVEDIEILLDGALVTTVALNTTTYTYTGLTDGRSYTVGVRPVNAAATGNATTASVTAVTIPAAPTALTATAGTSEVRLAWNAVTGSTSSPVTGYRVYQEIAGVFTLAGSSATPSLTIDGLSNGETYRFKVAAYGTAGEGLRSSTSSATPLDAPVAASTLTSTLANRSITVSWDAITTSVAAPVDSIDLLRDGVVVANVASNSTSYLFSGLTAGTEYQFGVRSKNSVASSTTSSITVTAITLPAAPASFTAVAGVGHVTLDWDAVASSAAAPVSGYRVYQEIAGVATIIGSSATTTFDATGLTNGTSYRFEVAAYGSVGEGLRSASVSSTPLDTPAVITNLVPSLGNRTVTATWSAAVSTTSAPVTGIEVLRSGIVITTLTPNATSYTFSGLTAGTEYTLGVRPLNAVSTATVTTSAVTAVTLADAPAGFTATASTAKVTLDWNAVTSTTSAPVSGYNVYQEIGGVMTLVGSTTDTTFTVNSLTNGTVYRFEAAAYGTAGEGARSILASSTPLAAPAAITNVVATLPSNSAVQITWNAATSTSAAPVSNIAVVKDGVVVATVSASTTSYTFTGLTAGTTYTLGVRAYNAVASSSASTVDAAPITVPAKPANFTVTAGNTSALLNWDAVTDSATPVNGYRVYQEISGVYTLVGSTSSTSSSIGSLTNGSTYRFQIAAYGPLGEGVRTASVAVVPVGIPGQVTGLSATTSAGILQLDWSGPVTSAAAPVTGYRVYQMIAGVPTLIGSGTDRTAFLALPTKVTYDIRVAAYGPAGEGATASITTYIPGTPPAVTITAVHGANASFTVDFLATSSVYEPITSFRVKVNGAIVNSPDSASSSATIVSSNVTGGLANGTQITIQVCSVNNQGTTCSSDTSHTVGRITTGTIAASSTFTQNDVFQVMGNGFTEDFTAAWFNPTSQSGGATVSATASGTAATTAPESTIDHNSTTGWSVPSGGAGWIRYDFGAGRSVVPNAMKIIWANATPTTSIQASNDGTNWVSLWSRNTATGTQDTYYNERYSWTNDDAYRYVRINKPDTTTGWFSIREIEIYGRVHMYPTVNPWSVSSAAYTIPTHVTTAQQGSYVYIAGGTVNGAWTNSFLRYDMATNTMTSLATLPRAVDSASAVIYNNNLYLISGRYAASSDNRDIQVYSIANNTWSTLVDRVSPTYATTSVLYGSKVYMFGGVSSGIVTRNVRYIDLAAGSISETLLADMPFGSNAAMASSLSGGYMYLFGGYDQSSVPSSQVHAYDPVSKVYTTLTSLPQPRAITSAVTLSDGRIALAGGLSASLTATASVDVLTPTAGGGIQISGSYPLTGSRLAAATGYYNGKLAVLGGGYYVPAFTMRNNYEVRSGM